MDTKASRSLQSTRGVQADCPIHQKSCFAVWRSSFMHLHSGALPAAVSGGITGPIAWSHPVNGLTVEKYSVSSGKSNQPTGAHQPAAIRPPFSVRRLCRRYRPCRRIIRPAPTALPHEKMARRRRSAYAANPQEALSSFSFRFFMRACWARWTLCSILRSKFPDMSFLPSA